MTASNQGASATATSAHTATITAATTLTNTSPPTITGEATDLQTLTAHPGEWTGSAPIAYAYQWQICAAEGSECFEIPGGRRFQRYRVPSGRHRLETTGKPPASNAAGTSSARAGSSATTAVVAAAPAPPRDAPRHYWLGPAQPGAAVAELDGGTWQYVSAEPASRAVTYQSEALVQPRRRRATKAPVKTAPRRTYDIARAPAAAPVYHRARPPSKREREK